MLGWLSNTVACHSELFQVEQIVAAFEHGKSSEADLVLLTHVAHVKILLAVEDVQLPLPVHECAQGNRCEGPHDEFFEHEHAAHAGEQAECRAIRGSTHVDVPVVLALGHVHPVLLYRRLVIVDAAVEHILSEEAHAKIDGGLVLGWDASVVLVEMIEVILGLCFVLFPHYKRHSFSFPV